jgi:hypothetical protein
MKIIASGAPIPVDVFLHAGYVSAYPHADWFTSIPSRPDGIAVLNVDASLRLKDHSPSKQLSPSPSHPLLGGYARSLSSMAIGIILFVLLAGFLHRLRRRSPRLVVVLLSTLACCLVAGAVFDDMTQGRLHRAGAGRSSASGAASTAGGSAYESPREATLVLMRGVIADAVINAEKDIRSLDDVRPYIGLPTPEPTESMSYAMSNFTRDGWGRPFEFSKTKTREESPTVRATYSLKSVGPDGTPNTDDDISMSLEQFAGGEFGLQDRAFFSVKKGNDVMVLFRRWPHGVLLPVNREAALRGTGDVMFDTLRLNGSEMSGPRHKKGAYGRFWRMNTTLPDNRLLLWIDWYEFNRRPQ